MKFLIDMNLSPRWCSIFQAEGWDSVHWSAVGIASAPDPEIMQWALADGRAVFTNDLDFGTLLALTRAAGPSVVQVRTQDVRCESLSPRLIPVLHKYQSELERGTLLVIDEAKSRVRLLPLF